MRVARGRVNEDSCDVIQPDIRLLPTCRGRGALAVAAVRAVADVLLRFDDASTL